jgi:hypothetical protein
MLRTLAILGLSLAFFATATRVWAGLEVASGEQASSSFDAPDDDEASDPPLVDTLPHAELAQLVRQAEELVQEQQALTSRCVDKRLKRPPRV